MVIDVDEPLTVFLRFPVRLVQTVKDLADTILLLVSGVFQKLVPLVFAQEIIDAFVVFLDLEDHHTPRLWLIEKRVEGFGGDATRDPTSKVFPVANELQVCVERVRLVDGEILWLIVAWWGSSYALWHFIMGESKG